MAMIQASRIQLDPREVRLARNKELKIWCMIRKRWMHYTPEEVVRQCLLKYLEDIGYSLNHIAVEKTIQVNGASRRYDILVYSSGVTPHILVECKAPSVSLGDVSLTQLLNYNLSIKARFLMVSNGISTYVYDTKKHMWVDDITLD